MLRCNYNEKSWEDAFVCYFWLQGKIWIKFSRFASASNLIHLVAIFSFRDHSFSTYIDSSQKSTFLTPWCAHLRELSVGKKCYSMLRNVSEYSATSLISIHWICAANQLTGICVMLQKRIQLTHFNPMFNIYTLPPPLKCQKPKVFWRFQGV